MRRRPRVLVLTPDFPPARGGIQTLAHQVVSNFRELDSHVVALKTEGAAEFDRAQDFAVRRIGAAGGPRSASIVGLNVAGLALAQRIRPDLVLSLHIVASPAAVLLQKALGIPFVQYVYAKELGTRPGLATFAVRHARMVIAISEYARVLAMAAGADTARIRLIHPGVELPDEVVRVPADRPTILTIARLEDRYKGHDVLMRAMPVIRAAVPQVQWVVIGDGPLRPALQDAAAAVGVDDCVYFLGGVSDAERNAWLSRSDVLVMPSRMPAQGLAGEGFGIVYLEANAYGMPAIGGNVAGALDAIVDGETGLLVDPTDPLDVAASIVRILGDREFAERLGRQGMDRAQDFAWPKVSARVEHALLELAGRPSPPVEAASASTA